MTELDLSRNLLGANANFKAEDWGTFGASAALDARAAAVLRRGFDLELGAEALVRLDASVSKFLVASAQGHAHAAARLRAQVQVPLDLFQECGLAVRLQATAEAAAGITIGLGLSIGDFIALAEQDPRMVGAPARLLRVFLEELSVSGTLTAKAAASAMAYANLAITGQLVPSRSTQPGFTVAAEAGVGLKAGAGFRVSATFGVDDPRRLLRRSIDVAVDETVASIATLIPASRERSMLSELRAPVKMAFRTAFELGLELAQNNATHDRDAGPRLAQRCVQVFLEEAQRELLNQLGVLGLSEMRTALAGLGATRQVWDLTHQQRHAFADRLEAMPVEAFDPTPQNLAYWGALVEEGLALVIALGAQPAASARLVDALSVTWSAAQLLFVSVKRISTVEARATVLGVPPAQATGAFEGSLDFEEPPAGIRAAINGQLGRPSQRSLRQQDLVAFLVSHGVEQMSAVSPETVAVLDLVTGSAASSTAEALSLILGNLGAFSPGNGAEPDPVGSLRVIVDGLRRYVNTRLEKELAPLLSPVLVQNDPSLQIYLDEVLLSTLRFTVDTTFTAVLNWASGSDSSQTALREACSSVLMRLLGRTLVVTGDVLLQSALEDVQGGLREAAGHVDDAGGIAPVLAAMTGVNRSLLADIMTETLEVAAETFGPLPAARRGRIRELLYELLDTMPVGADDNFLGQLESAGFVPGGEAAQDLALELGGYIGDVVVRFIEEFLDRVGRLLLEALQDVLADLEAAVEEFLSELDDLIADLAAGIRKVLANIKQLETNLDVATDRILLEATQLLNAFAKSSNKTRLRKEVRTVLRKAALGELANNTIYTTVVPARARPAVRAALDTTIDTVLQTGMLDPILGQLGGLSTQTAAFLDDIRDIKPGENVVEAVTELFVDRVEDGIRSAFGRSNPRIDIRFTVKFFEWKWTINLGKVEVKLRDIVIAGRRAARGLAVVEELTRSIAENLLVAIETELDLRAAEEKHGRLIKQHHRSSGVLNESQRTGFETLIASPAPASVHHTEVDLEIRLTGVPRSWLGLVDDDETPRVLIWMNDREVPVSTFDIRDGLRPAINSGPSIGAGLQLMPSNVARLDEVELLQRPRSASDPTGHVPAPPPASLHARHGTTTPATLSPTTVSREIDAARGLLGRPGSVTANQTLQLSGTSDVTLGRSIRASQKNVLDALGQPGLVLRRRLPLNELVEGTNTIAISVIGARPGTRVDRVTTFVVGPLDSAPNRPGRTSGRRASDTVPPSRIRRDDPTEGSDLRRATDNTAELQPSNGFWILSRAEQQSRLANSRKTHLTIAAARRENLQTMRAALTDHSRNPEGPPESFSMDPPVEEPR